MALRQKTMLTKGRLNQLQPSFVYIARFDVRKLTGFLTGAVRFRRQGARLWHDSQRGTHPANAESIGYGKGMVHQCWVASRDNTTNCVLLRWRRLLREYSLSSTNRQFVKSGEMLLLADGNLRSASLEVGVKPKSACRATTSAARLIFTDF